MRANFNIGWRSSRWPVARKPRRSIPTDFHYNTRFCFDKKRVHHESDYDS